MEDDKSPQIKPTEKIPRSKDNAINLRALSMREFETFLILLKHEGEVQSTLKQFIDLEFNYRSPTKAYDYINNLCYACPNCGKKNKKKKKKKKEIKEEKEEEEEKKICKCGTRKGFVYKKKITVKGKRETRIYIRSTVRKKYDKFILPTVTSFEESLNAIIEDYADSIKEEEKIREKFRLYTETILQAINNMLEDTPTKSLTKRKLQKKITDTMWRYFRAEMLKTEMFSR